MILLKLLNLIKNSECVLGPTIVESEFFVLQSYFQTKLLKVFSLLYPLLCFNPISLKHFHENTQALC